MKIVKAIEILEDILQEVEPGNPPEEHDAIKLGIEAMKRVSERDSISCWKTLQPLPGETPE